MTDLIEKANQFADRMENGPYVHLKDTRDLLREMASELERKDDILFDIYQVIWPLFIKAELNEDHPVLQAIMDRIMDIPNEHDGKTLQEVLALDEIRKDHSKQA